MKAWLEDWRILVVLCLTLGMAPYFPEPHLLGKLRWLAGGGRGMEPIDYFDTVLHGFPWILLLRRIALAVFRRARK